MSAEGEVYFQCEPPPRALRVPKHAARPRAPSHVMMRAPVRACARCLHQFLPLASTELPPLPLATQYDNPDAPYTQLRVEVWDRDLLNPHDFIGEATLLLCPLMDSRTHTYTLPLTDPEGKSHAPDGVQGSLTIEVAYDS